MSAIRKTVIDLVLATDMKQHFALNGAFASMHRLATAQGVDRAIRRLRHPAATPSRLLPLVGMVAPPKPPTNAASSSSAAPRTSQRGSAPNAKQPCDVEPALLVWHRHAAGDPPSSQSLPGAVHIAIKPS